MKCQINQVMAERRSRARAREKLERHITQILDTLPSGLADDWYALEEEFVARDAEEGFDHKTRIHLAFYNAARFIVEALVTRNYDIRLPD